MLIGRMQDETARVEDALLDRDATLAIMNCFVQSSGSHLEKVIDRCVFPLSIAEIANNPVS
jgi:hypothetical protein